MATSLMTILAGAGPAVAALPTPQGGYGSYHKVYYFTDLPRCSPDQMMAQFNSDVDHYFTFTGCGRHLELNESCHLMSPVGSAPVRVAAVERNGFALVSLPGHPEGAGRIITFPGRGAAGLRIG